MNRYVGNGANEAAAEGRSSSIISGMVMAAGTLGQSSTFQRFIVEEVIFDPTEFDDERLDDIKQKYGLSQAAFLKQMPPNTVIARLINQTAAGHERFHYLFPFLPPHVMLPIHVGEHVWAFFEHDKAIDYGYWMWRITEPRHVDDVNHTHADRKYHATEKQKTSKDKFEGTPDETPGFENGPTFTKDGQTNTIGESASSHDPDPKIYEKLIKETDAGKISEMEAVPRYKKRPGDHVIQGSNNALIVLGTDRTGRTAKFKKGNKGKIVDGKPDNDQNGGAGTIDLVVGRGQTDKTAGKKIDNSINKKEISKRISDEKVEEGDPDFASDLGRLYLSMKTDPDGNLDINFSEKVGPGVPAGIIKTDHARIVVRKTLKMLVQPRPGAPESECSGILFKDGNVVFIPSETGLVLLGGEDASMSPLCQPQAINSGGTVTAPPITSTLGSQVGLSGPNGQFPKKVLMK
jgi:hypothetical protein